MEKKMIDKSQVIANICNSLKDENSPLALEIFLQYAPFDKNYKSPQGIKITKEGGKSEKSEIELREKRKYNNLETTCLFIRDGFIDRYDGNRLVFIGTLRLLSEIFPNEFPYQPNWRTDACHRWYWDLAPTLDHVVAITHGGAGKDNWITTSMVNNLKKSNIPLEILGWKILPPGNFNEWDGLIHWFINYVEKRPEVLKKKNIMKWYKTAKKALEINKLGG